MIRFTAYLLNKVYKTDRESIIPWHSPFFILSLLITNRSIGLLLINRIYGFSCLGNSIIKFHHNGNQLCTCCSTIGYRIATCRGEFVLLKVPNKKARHTTCLALPARICPPYKVSPRETMDRDSNPILLRFTCRGEFVLLKVPNKKARHTTCLAPAARIELTTNP